MCTQVFKLSLKIEPISVWFDLIAKLGTLKHSIIGPANCAFPKDALTTFCELALGRESLLDATWIHKANPQPSPEARPLANRQ